MSAHAVAIAAMPTRVTVRTSRKDLYQSIFALQVLLLVLTVALLDGLEEDLAQVDGGDVDIDGAALAAKLGDGVGVAAGEDGDLAAVAAHLLDPEDGFESRRCSGEAERDAAVVLADLL